MLQDVLNNIQTLHLDDYQKKEQLLAKIKERFATYGYRQIQTSTFEQYDLYQSITGTINKEEMIKVIDPTGKVLVLRPDVTIPITRMAAAGNQMTRQDERLFYISNVFRNASGEQEKREHTQAGIENFGPGTIGLDAEVIALAIHTLHDLGFENFKLEIGHAGFFKELIGEINISEQDTKQLQDIIQAKNVSGIEAFLEKLPIDTNSKRALKQIPLLYGKPEAVIKRAETVVLNNRMRQELQNLISLFEVLKLYNAERFISFDLGLINHMNYYSGIIFQGFVENFGKPVLMGGRYNQLAEKFNKAMPAIGFACDVDSIVEVMQQQSLLPDIASPIDLFVYYTNSKQQEALATAQELRMQGFRVLVDDTDSPHETISKAIRVIRYQKDENLVDYQPFSDMEELLQLLKEGV